MIRFLVKLLWLLGCRKLVVIDAVLERAALHAEARLRRTVALQLEDPHEVVDAAVAWGFSSYVMRVHEPFLAWLPSSLAHAEGQGSPSLRAWGQVSAVTGTA